MPDTRIYQVFCGRWKSANLLDHPGQVFALMTQWPWDRLATLGFDAVYLLGLWDSQGPLIATEEEGVDLTTMPTRVPSVFAITDHTQPHPLLGTIAELKKLISTIQSHSLTVLTDIVPNQTSLVHPWLTLRPEYYLRNENGEVLTGFSGDVALLNTDHPGVQIEMITSLLTIKLLGFDGIRADMAHLPRIEYWKQVLEADQHNPPVLTRVAESYEQDDFAWSASERLLASGFDLIYHAHLYRVMRGILHGSLQMSDVINHLSYVTTSGRAKSLLHYLSNHDDEYPYPQLLPSWYVLLQLLPGSYLHCNGTLMGRTRRLAHHWAELLPDDQSELFGQLPAWVESYQAWRGSSTPNIKSMKIEDDFLLLHVIHQNEIYQISLNVRNRQVSINLQNHDIVVSEGLLEDVLESGGFLISLMT